MKKLLLLGLSVLILSLLLVSGCVDVQVKESCESIFDDCNYSCGEGIGNSICKTGCTNDFNNCKEKRG